MNHELEILVVDDELPVRKVMRRILQEDGYKVTTAADGAEGLLKFQQNPVPIVFTDIYMPKMSGIELLQKLKQHPKDPQVIMMTGYASTESAISTLRAGAYDYILKPFEDNDVIISTVRRAASRVRLQDETQRLMEMLKQKTESLETANANLIRLATHDSLTGLYNHRYFLERLVSEINRSERYIKRFSMLFIDLDYFKIYNDTHGHLKGDQLLRSLSIIFMDSFRQTDVVARYGGDEFVVILPETPKDQAIKLAAKLQRRVMKNPFAGIQTMPRQRISVTVGVAAFPQDGTSAEALLQCADQNMYAAKARKHLLDNTIG